jgi:hypothetical protein
LVLAPARKFNDITKLAGERAASRILHTEIEIVFKFEQVENVALGPW